MEKDHLFEDNMDILGQAWKESFVSLDEVYPSVFHLSSCGVDISQYLQSPVDDSVSQDRSVDVSKSVLAMHCLDDYEHLADLWTSPISPQLSPYQGSYSMSDMSSPISCTEYPMSSTPDLMSSTADCISSTGDSISSRADSISSTGDSMSSRADSMSNMGDSMSSRADSMYITSDSNMSNISDPMSSTSDLDSSLIEMLQSLPLPKTHTPHGKPQTASKINNIPMKRTTQKKMKHVKACKNGCVKPDKVCKNGCVKPDKVCKNGCVKPEKVCKNGCVKPEKVSKNGRVKPDKVCKKGCVKPDKVCKNGCVKPDKVCKNGCVKKPKATYMELIVQALLTNPAHKMELCDVYNHMMKNHAYYRTCTVTWKNTVRHNLSTMECFVKAGKGSNGYYWGIHPACVKMLQSGDYRRHEARRCVLEAEQKSRKAIRTISGTSEGRSSPCSSVSEGSDSPYEHGNYSQYYHQMAAAYYIHGGHSGCH